MARKRKTLPKDFEARLQRDTLAELIAVFEQCELTATSGAERRSALHFEETPEGLVTWLVEQGLDVDISDQRQRTPLWILSPRRSARAAERLALLLSLGADVEAADSLGQTPLSAAISNQSELSVRVLLEGGARAEQLPDRGAAMLEKGLARTGLTMIAPMAAIAELLLERGVPVSGGMREQVSRLGQEFEFFRDKFTPEQFAVAEPAMGRLNRAFGVADAEPIVRHDGRGRIEMPAGTWQQQHEALWNLLVPGDGAAQTVQGEAIRVTGRIANELLGNGGVNWDRDFRAMADALASYLGAGNPLDAGELGEVEAVVRALTPGVADSAQQGRLAELAVRWVGQNPDPISLGEVPYRR